MWKRIHLSIFIFTHLFTCNIHAAEPPKRLLIIPFHINSSEDLGFLVKGIQDMLSTRLSIEDTVIPMDPVSVEPDLQSVSKPISEQAAFQLGLTWQQ